MKSVERLKGIELFIGGERRNRCMSLDFSFAFVVWQTVGLVRLRRFNRWFGTVFLGWWTISTLWNISTILSGRGTNPTSRIIIFVALVFNVLSVWYLSRRSFREFAVQFLTEQDKEKQFP